MFRGSLKSQRGETASDYLGVLLVVGMIVAALAMSGLPERIATHIEVLICRIAGGDCQPAETVRNPYEPTYPCVQAGATNKVTLSGSFNVRFVNVKLEGGVEYERIRRSDGTVAITVRLSTKGKVGPALASKLKSALPEGTNFSLNGGQEGGVTFVLPNDEAANRFADQLKETTKALAAGPIVSRIMGWDADIDVPPVESVYYQTGPGATISVGADAGTAYAEGKLDVSHALGVRHNVRNGETTVYYNGKGSVEGNAGYLAAQFGRVFNGEVTLGLTLDSRGRPKRLTLIGIGSGEFRGGPGNKYKNLDQLLKGLGANVTLNNGAGKRFEVQADLDLTNPALRDAALAALQGVNPVTGSPADAGQAARDLWNALVQSSTVSVRSYDTRSSQTGGEIDVAGNGGGINYETTDRELNGAWYLDPTRGLVPWEACTRQ